MEKSKFVLIPRVSFLALPELNIAPKSDEDCVAAYALILSFSIFAYMSLTILWGKYGRFKQKNHVERIVWYNHLDPLLGLDVLWACAKAVSQSRLLEMTRSIVSPSSRTVSYLYLGKQAVLTIDPLNLKAVLSGRFGDYGLGSTRKNSLQPLFGSGIFNSDGATWKSHRAMLRPFLSRVRDVELGIFEDHLQHLINVIPKDGSTFDIQSIFTSFTLDVSTDVFLGASTNLLSSKEADRTEGQQFAKAFDYAQRTLVGIDDFNILNMIGKWMFGDRQLQESLDIVHKFVDKVLDRSLQQHCIVPEQDAPQKNNESFLNSLLGAGRPRSDMKYDILNIVLAGKDTMAAYLSSIWYVLSQRPDIYKKLSDEVSILGGKQPTKEDLYRLPYLQQVLQEVLRLFPPVAINQRTAEVDTVLPHGGGPDGQSPIRVPRGTSIGYSVYAMHRIPEYFGQNVDEFRPERWSEIRPQWAFMPFHAGPRMCLGQQFALGLAKYCTVRLIQHFPRLEDRNEQPWQEKLGLNCSSRHGVKLGFRCDH